MKFLPTKVFSAFTVLIILCFASIAHAISLQITYPAGESPNVFTEGWVFGARAYTDDGKDISDEVIWSGSGEFTPNKGSLSYPKFNEPGENTIQISINYDGEELSESYAVSAVSPYAGAGFTPLYAKLGDIAKVEADSHGCPADPHTAQGPIISGSPNVTIGGLPAARVGDDGVHASCCGPNTFYISSGDENVLIDGKPAARLGDTTQHCGGIGKIVGPALTYYAVFAATFPEIKEEKKPKKKKGEDDDAWKRRKTAEINRLTYNDFIFVDKTVEENPFIIRVSNSALQTYPQEFFARDSKWAMKVDVGLKGENGEFNRLDGTMLLTVKGVYTSMQNLYGFHPKLKDKKSLKTYEFSDSKGISQMKEAGSEFKLGPLTMQWREEDRRDSVRLMKQALIAFDCFIAHVVYENYDASKINIFREFRDKVLLNSEAGRHLIRLYYEYGPEYAILRKSDDDFVNKMHFVLDVLTEMFSNLDYDDEKTLNRMHGEVFWIDKAFSYFYEEGGSRGLGQITRYMMPIILEKNYE